MWGAAPVHAEAGTDSAAIAKRLAALDLPADAGTLGMFDTVDSSFGENENFTVFMMGCDGEQKNCRYLRFHAGYTESDAGEAVIEQFNSAHPAAHAFIDGSGDPAIYMDLESDELANGAFETSVSSWRQLMAAFADTIYPQ